MGAILLLFCLGGDMDQKVNELGVVDALFWPRRHSKNRNLLVGRPMNF